MSRDLIERLRAHAEGRHGLRMQITGAEKVATLLTEKNDLMREAADRIAALEAEASEGERRGLEQAIALVEDNRLADRGEGPSYASVHNKACSRIANGLRALIPEAPAQSELGSAAANQISTPEFGFPEAPARANPEDDPRYPALLADAKARVRNENLDGSPRRHAVAKEGE